MGGTWYATVISDLAQSVRKLLLVNLELRADFWVLSMEHSGNKWRGRAGNVVGAGGKGIVLRYGW